MAEKRAKELSEVFQFLSLDSQEDVKSLALNYFLGLTASTDGMELVEKSAELLERIVQLTCDKCLRVQANACVFLLNASASPVIAEKVVEYKIFEKILPRIFDRDLTYADKVAMLLSNLSRLELGCATCLESIENLEECSLSKILEVLCQEKYNKHTDLHHLAGFVSNLSRYNIVRMSLLDKSSGIMQNLLSFLSFQTSVVRRKGTAGIIRNCCFEFDYHDWLLGDDIDILPALLLPLAGPEEFSESENEQLPLDLQYLEESKKREPDSEIRKMLVEAILMLCSTKSGRQYVKQKNTYVIIRELHKWEKDASVCVAIENLVQILIGDEPAETMADLHKVEIPEDVKQQFEKLEENMSQW